MGDRAGEGIAYCNLGIACNSLGDFQGAIEYHKQYLSISKEEGNRAGERRACGNLGNAYHSLCNFQGAIEYHKQALSISKEIGDRTGEGRAYGNLGNAYRSLGDFHGAIEYHKQALSIYKEVGKRTGEGGAYGNLGIAYESLGDFQGAIEYHKQALSISKDTGDRTGEGKAYCNLGIAYKSLGDFQGAIEYHNQALSISKEVGDRTGEGKAYCNLGIAYESLGDFQGAIEHHKRHLSISKEVGDRAGQGKAYCNLGNAYDSLGDFQGAIEYHKRDLSISKEVGDKAGEGRAYGNLGNAYDSLGDFQGAIEYHKRHLSISKEVGDRAGEGRSNFNLGNSFWASGSLNEALTHLRCSVETYNTIRASCISKDEWKISFRELCKDSYTSLCKLLIQLQRTDEALYTSEQGRAQALLDALKLVYGFNSPATESQEVINYIFTLRESSVQTVFLALLEDTINMWVLGKKRDAIFRQVKLENRDECVDPFTDLLKRVLKSIGAGVGVRCENRSLSEAIDDPLFQGGDKAQQREPSHNNSGCFELLHNALISPIEDLLDGDELIVVPDGSLSLAPWAALSECLHIRTIPSLTSLKLITGCPPEYHNKIGALLVGDPSLEKVREKGKPKYKQLHYAKLEVEMIGQILNSQPLTGEYATKQEVLTRIQSVALVHIAAHGDVKTGEIALAPNPESQSNIPKEEYMLKMSDIQAVKLRARLVVLSCCHSGKGELKSEGVVGIARAFLFAGARSVLVSLWAIDDEATMEYMRSFYKHLKNGKSASVALQKAMKRLQDSDRFSAPKYWAPFVLIGDDVTIQFDENH